ncbi:hypothetical protein V9T40_000293 [Parthenolecanium corni]|uniref:Uncharacterized protein n=1 Tax=Parthenolecanium corni TaxID=536013 RepID=A0AAN9TAX1_9HEMI
MAVRKFELAFLALAFACLLQNALAAPRSPKSENLSELEIVGRAAGEIAQSFKEFVNSVVSAIVGVVAEGIVKVGLPVFARAHFIFTASGIEDTSLAVDGERRTEYRIVAKTVMQMRQKLDKMERFEEELDLILVQVARSILKPSAMGRKTGVTTLLLSFSEAVDTHFRQHPEFKDIYLRVREDVEAEDAVAPTTRLDFSTMKAEKVLEIIPEPVKNKLMAILVNKQFLHHTLNRLTIRKEYFVMARSTLELAKKREKLEIVQRIYDDTLRQVGFSLDIKADVFDISKGLFKELKSHFEANPSLKQEWREMQKYVSQRHEWDRGIWDLDLLPV